MNQRLRPFQVSLGATTRLNGNSATYPVRNASKMGSSTQCTSTSSRRAAKVTTNESAAVFSTRHPIAVTGKNGIPMMGNRLASHTTT